MSKHRRHVVIPDTQIKPGVPMKHLDAISNYLQEKRPDVIVHLGDHADMPSLSSYSLAGEREGKRYKADIGASREGMARLTAFRRFSKNYKPRMELTLGNHENRIARTVDEHPHLQGTMSLNDLAYESYGWKVNPFLKVARIDGIEYSHYFVSGPMGRPLSSAQAMLRERQSSCIQGHVQSFQMAVHPKTQKTAIMAGTCYLHDETYLGPQGQDCKRQIVVLNEVSNGRFDAMFVSLAYLLRAYS